MVKINNNIRKIKGYSNFYKKWIYGFPYYIKENDDVRIMYFENGRRTHSAVDPNSIGEFVQDDLYTGDIVYGCSQDVYCKIIDRWYGLLFYNEEKSMFMFKDSSGDTFLVDDYDFDGVVGNKFTHPELI